MLTSFFITRQGGLFLFSTKILLWTNKVSTCWNALYSWTFFVVFQLIIFSIKYSFFKVCVLVKYRRFQLGTIYCRSIDLIRIKFGMRLTCTNTHGRCSWFFSFLFDKILIFRILRLTQISHLLTLSVMYDLFPSILPIWTKFGMRFTDTNSHGRCWVYFNFFRLNIWLSTHL